MGWPIVGKIAAAGLGALGAYKSAKAMRGANDLDLQKLRREAEQNGFNPLTVLRATGGQGSTKGPSGNLASGAFFQTFAQGIPSILEANYNKKMKQAQLTNINLQNQEIFSKLNGLNTVRTTISPTEVLGTAKLDSNQILNNKSTSQNLGIYKFEQDPVSRETVTAKGFGSVSAKIKPTWGNFELRNGKRIPLPFTEFEADQMLTQGAFNLFMEAIDIRDQALSKVSNWWNSSKKDATPMSDIAKNVNLKRITNNIQQTPQLSTQQFKTIRGITKGIRKTQDEIMGY